MKITCPSCGAPHQSEDYPGAFDILCACGYLILNPEIGNEGTEKQNVNFEGPPVASEDSSPAIALHSDDAELDLALDDRPDAVFSAEKLTPPEELPEGMLYDPVEIPKEAPAARPPESTLSKMFVERLQRASIGQILGPDYNLEFTELDSQARLKSRERIEKFLQDHKWLREEMERRSFIIEDLFQQERIFGIPEALAVEMYIACLENGGKCLFIRPEQSNPI